MAKEHTKDVWYSSLAKYKLEEQKRYCHTSNRKAVIEKLTIPNASKHAEQQWLLLPGGRNTKWYIHLGS